MSDQLTATIAALRRHVKLIIALPLIAVAVSLVISLNAEKKYTATATVLLLTNNPVDQLLNPASSVTPADPERDLNTAVSQITQAPVLAKVRQAAHLTEDNQDLLAQVTTTVDGTTNLVDISVTDPDPVKAATIANAFAAQYVNYRLGSARSAIDNAIQLVTSELAGGASGAVRTQLQSRLQQLQVYSSVQTSDAQISQPATVPTSPSSPKPVRNAVIALLAGLVIALVVAIAIDALDRRVRDESEGERAAGVDLLARIPGRGLGRRREGAARRPAGLKIDAIQAEGYRSLAVMVNAMMRADPDAHTLLITSPSPRDGKTTVSLGLAGALSELGQRVVAIECDLRRPRFAELLSLPTGTGVSTILAGTGELAGSLVELDSRSLRPAGAEVDGEPGTEDPAPGSIGTIVRTRKSSLKVVPAGIALPQPQPLLATQAMNDLLTQARADADIVVVDTPPVGVVSDAVLLGPLADRALLVGRIGWTRRAGLGKARDTLEQRGVEVMGLVLVGGPRASLKYYG